MRKSKDTLARAYALEILAPLNRQARINKEKLFADAVLYYRWLLSDDKAPDALEVYWNEFKGHHKSLVAGMQPDIRVAGFITWFVEQHFHEQPPLACTLTADEHLCKRTEHASFSAPSFRLPTGDPVESYLIQWLYWHLDNLPASEEQTDTVVLACWAEGMIDEVLEQHKLSSDECAAFLESAVLFFAWSRRHVRAWDTFMNLFVAFLRSEIGLAIDQSDTPLADVCFVHWFCQYSRLCPAEDAIQPATLGDQRVSAEE